MPLNLAELPEEIILHIFRHVHDAPIPDRKCRPHHDGWTPYHVGIQAIQNIRLTCQLFNRISSELLVKFVAVDISLESLTRLQAIMRHPTIGKGVRMVRIRLQTYDWILAQSLSMYAIEVTPSMRPVGAGIGRPAFQSGRRHTLNGPMEAALEPEYLEYKRQYEAQYRLSKRKFVVDLGNALMMSGIPLRIEITDQNDFHWRHAFSATPDQVLDLAPRPEASTWEELHSRSPNEHRSLAYMIPLMLAAFTDDHIRIEHLHFDITRLNPTDRLVLAEMNTGAIQKALRNLRRFTYICGGVPNNTGDGKGLGVILYNCLPPDSLQTLTLEGVEFDPQHHLPKLTEISLTSMPINAKRLSILLQPLEPHSVVISLMCCYVFRGSWRNVLDLLRSKQRWATLSWPSGVEFSWGRMFEKITLWRNCEKYIRGFSDTNPLPGNHVVEEENMYYI